MSVSSFIITVATFVLSGKINDINLQFIFFITVKLYFYTCKSPVFCPHSTPPQSYSCLCPGWGPQLQRTCWFLTHVIHAGQCCVTLEKADWRSFGELENIPTGSSGQGDKVRRIERRADRGALSHGINMSSRQPLLQRSELARSQEGKGKGSPSGGPKINEGIPKKVKHGQENKIPRSYLWKQECWALTHFPAMKNPDGSEPK